MMDTKKGTATVRIIIGSLDIGGTETHIVRLLPDLAGKGFGVSVITLTHKGQLAAKLEEINIPVFGPPGVVRFFQRIPLVSRLTGPAATLLYLFCMFSRKHADITCFYLPTSYYLGMIASMLTGEEKKTVMFRRSLNNYQQGRFLIKRYESWLHKRVEIITGNSQAVINQLRAEEGVRIDKLRLIYNGVGIPDIDVKNIRYKVRSECETDNNTLLLSIVANLIPYKGHADLLNALSLIKDELTDPWMLLAVGMGIETRKDLLQQVSEYGLEGHIRWMGQRQDVAEIYAASDIGLLVSHQESFSNAVLEGMAAGIPMIVTDVGGNSEAVLHEKCGLVVESHHPDQIASAILTLANNSEMRKEFGENAKARVATEFSHERCLRKYIDLFNELTIQAL